MDTLAAIRARAVASLIPLPRSIHLQLISNSSLSRGISSFSFALRLRNFILTRGGMAKSTSRYAVPIFIVLWMRFAVAALVMSADTNTPLLAALAAIAFTFAMSELPFDFNRSRALGGRPQVTLNTVTS